MCAMLQCIDVCKSYPDFSLKSISFDLESGYLTGMVGINGAGKSTLINILAGIDSKYSGRVVIDGSDLREDYEDAKQKVAIVSERICHFMDKTPLENGEMLGIFFKNWKMECFYEWLDRLELPKGQPLYQLSKGMYMKYQLAFAMSYGAKFLLLDEPTAGFDPVFRKDFMRIVQEIRDREIGILMSTHILSDIEQISDYILMIDNGEVKWNEENASLGRRSMSELLENSRDTRFHIGELLKRNGGGER